MGRTVPSTDARHPLVEEAGSPDHRTRADSIAEAQSSGSVLEIGPFHNPSLVGANVAYFDLLDRDDLVARVAEYRLKGSRIPEHIDYVSPVGDLSVIDRTFDAVFSAHVVEHQPDLIRHFNQVADILEVGGHYLLLVPDKRYCFDNLLPETTLGAVVEAHLTQRKVHATASLINAKAFKTHNEKARHWIGDHGSVARDEELARSALAALEEERASDGAYIDMHAWQFTPDSFAQITNTTYLMGLSRLRPVSVSDTLRGRHEFAAVFECMADFATPAS